MKQGAFRFLMFFVASICACEVQAHIMVANIGTVSIKEKNTYVALSVPVSALTGFDDNHDSLIDATELGRHSGELRVQIDGRIRILADGAKPIEGMTFLISPLTGEDEDAPIDYLVVMSVQRFDKAPQTVEFWTDLFGTTQKDQRISFTASKDQTEELAVLTPDQPDHRFFRSEAAVNTVQP